MSRPSPEVPWNSLDLDVFLEVVRLLSDDLLRMAKLPLVCKGWRSMCKKAPIRKQITLKAEVDEPVSAEWDGRLLCRLLRVKTPSPQFLPLMPQLLKLQLDCSGTKLNSLERATVLVNLESMDLSGCHGLLTLEPMAHLTGLRSVNISGCKKMVSVAPLAGNLGLTKLVMPRTAVTGIEVVRQFTALTLLDLNNCHELKSLEPLRGHPTLEVLNVVGVKPEIKAGIELLLDGLPCLRHTKGVKCRG